MGHRELSSTEYYIHLLSEKLIKTSGINWDSLEKIIPEVSAFLDYIEHEKGCSISTRNHRLKCIKAFIKYAAMVDPTVVIYQAELSKIPIKKESHINTIEYMSETAIKTLLKIFSSKRRITVNATTFLYQKKRYS